MNIVSHKIKVGLAFAIVIHALSFLLPAQSSKPIGKPVPDVQPFVALPLTRAGEFENKDLLLPARGGSVDWGLAMSGGGIRSASFNIGVMKALYDAGLFDRLDAISSVSGGGYASYWLYGRYDAYPGRKFGDSAFADDVFLANTCSLQNDSDMYSLTSMFKALFRTNKGAFNDYQSAIHKTFGRSSEQLAGRQVNYFYDAVRSGSIPYFFLNTSISTGELSGLGNIVEITPGHIGNPILGYARWVDQPEKAQNFGQAVAAASAGIEFKLKKKVPNFAPHTLSSQSDLYLHDGGKSENLGALALIRCGLANVIIVDAGHDPDYIFEDYFRLKRLLKGLDIDLNVDEIEGLFDKDGKPGIAVPRFKTGVMTGKATNAVTGSLQTRIYYIKLSRPDNIFLPEEAAKMLTIEKKEEAKRLIKELYANGLKAVHDRDGKINKTGVGNGKYTVRCEGARDLHLKPEMYSYLVNRYGYYLDRTKWRRAGQIHKFLTYQFPQTTTLDQSFYSDQMEAFIGLGYLQAASLGETLKKEFTAR